MRSSLPQYLEIEAVLRAEVTELAPNSVLPTEVQLSKRFGVSRITIRRALEMLEDSGLISRQRGRGTIVSPPKILRRFSPLLSFERDLRDQGIDFETRLMTQDFNSVPPEFIRRRLNLAATDKVAYLVFIRLVHDRIICTDSRYIHPDVAARLDPDSLANGDTSRLVENAVAQNITSADWESEIVPCGGAVAGALGIAPGTLVVENTFTYFLSTGEAVEAGVMSYRVDRCKFQFGGTFNEPMTTE